jgi:hypothetical protein
MDIEQAVEWLFLHSDDPHADDPLSSQEIVAVLNLLRQFAGRTFFFFGTGGRRESGVGEERREGGGGGRGGEERGRGGFFFMDFLVLVFFFSKLSFMGFPAILPFFSRTLPASPPSLFSLLPFPLPPSTLFPPSLFPPLCPGDHKSFFPRFFFLTREFLATQDTTGNMDEEIKDCVRNNKCTFVA